MAYIELQDLEDELGETKLIQLSTDDPQADEPDEARINKAIEFAQGTFESYIRSRYSLPVPSTAMVKAINLDLAVFQLFKSRTSVAEGTYTVRENAYKASLQLLKDIAAGKAALDVPAAEETIDNPATSDKILTNASKSKFNDKTLSSF
jgi:phage gp36-like protein